MHIKYIYRRTARSRLAGYVLKFRVVVGRRSRGRAAHRTFTFGDGRRAVIFSARTTPSERDEAARALADLLASRDVSWRFVPVYASCRLTPRISSRRRRASSVQCRRSGRSAWRAAFRAPMAMSRETTLRTEAASWRLLSYGQRWSQDARRLNAGAAQAIREGG